MKFFSELGSCFYGGGAIITPAAEETCCSSLRSSSEQRNEEGGVSCGGRSSHEVAAATAGRLRKLKSASTSRNWKPKLHVISEDSVVMAHDSYPAVRSDEKLSVKVKAKSKAKVPSCSYIRGDDYWYSSSFRKSSSMWALPAFSPTPFSF